MIIAAQPFEARDKQELIEVFQNNELVKGNETVARSLAAVAMREELQAGATLFNEGETSDDPYLFFIIRGSIELLTDGERIFTLEKGRAVGEFPIVDKNAPYSVTVRAIEHTVFACITRREFRRIADAHVDVWRNLALMLVTRLRSKETSIVAVRMRNAPKLQLLKALFYTRRRSNWR